MGFDYYSCKVEIKKKKLSADFVCHCLFENVRWCYYTLETGLDSFSSFAAFTPDMVLYTNVSTYRIAGNTKCCDCISQRRFCIIINIRALLSCLEDVEGNPRSNLGRGGFLCNGKFVPEALFEQRKTLFEFSESLEKRKGGKK